MDYGFVDCHCHISAREFEEDLQDVIQRARLAGAQTLVAVVEEVGEFSRVLQLQERPAGGAGQRCVKPQDLDAAVPQFFAHRDQLVAVGEIGLDFTPWCAPTARHRDVQMRVFVEQLGVAKQLDLPVNVHSRSAAKVTIETLIEQGVRRALLHNFAGRPSVALEGVRAGYMFSFPPAVGRNHQRDKLIKQIPLEHICLETDSPALGLLKDVRNEPCNISLSCSYIAGVKGLPAQSVQLITAQNALRLFPKARRSPQSD